MGAAYSSLGRIKVLPATSLVLLGAKVEFLRRKCFGRMIRDMLTPIHVLCDCHTKIFRGLNVFQSLLLQSVVMNDLFV